MNRLVLAAALVLAVTCSSAEAQLLNPKATPVPTELERKLANEKDVADLQAMAGRFVAARDFRSAASVWKRLVELRPHVGRYKYELAASQAQVNEKSLAYNTLLEMQQQGYGFDLASDKRFALVATTEAWKYIVEGFDANRQTFGEGRVAYTLPTDDLLLESLAWDPTRKQLLVGSAREGKVFTIGKGGKLKPLIVADDENGMWAVFDLVVDAERRLLWVASTAVPHFKDYDAETDLGRAGLFRFDLETGKFQKRFLSPSGPGVSFFISTLALAPDGTVYAADGVNNAVYRVGDDQLQRVFHAPVLGSIRGMAVSGDGRTLYFADYERGVFGFDLVSNKPFEVRVPQTLALGGVDGLFWSENRLVAVQNGMEPKRIMRLDLSPDGRTIARVQPLAANQPALSMPTQGALAGKELYVIGNSQKFRYDRFGLPIDRSTLEGARVYQLDVDWTTKVPQAVPATSTRR